MFNYGRIMDFCYRHSHILVYGAGQYTWTVMPYLLSYGIHPEACLVSGKPGALYFMDEIKEFSIYDFDIKAGERYGIILSLQEIYHDDVKQNIKKVFGESADIFELSDDDISRLGQMIRTNRMISMLESGKELDSETKNIYECREKELLNGGKRILLRFIDMRSIGCLIAWIYWSYQRDINNKDGLFWLFWPSATPAHANMELVGANRYILDKLKREHMEVVSADSLGFWQYCYGKNKGSFIIDNGFSVLEWIKQLNTFIFLHGGAVAGNYLRFTKDEKRLGEQKAIDIGVKGKYICFFVRDDLYAKKVMKFTTDVHACVGEYRNATIMEYKSLGEKLKKRGIQLVRMGALAKDKIEWENTVDYASNYRSEFMDAWLFANCEFFVCTPSGIQAIAQLFSKPMAMFNLNLQSTRNDYGMFTNADKDLGIILKYKLRDENRFLTLREMLEIETDERCHPMASVGTVKAYDNMGIEIVKNTVQEVMDMTDEMIARLNGTIEYTEDDKYLQREYRRIVDSYPMKHNFPFIYRMGAKFLKANQWLLE